MAARTVVAEAEQPAADAGSHAVLHGLRHRLISQGLPLKGLAPPLKLYRTSLKYSAARRISPRGSRSNMRARMTSASGGLEVDL